MAFNRPTLSDLIQRVEGDLKSALSLSTILRRSFLAAIARAKAGVAHTLHGYIQYTGNQLFPDTQDEEFLKRTGTIYGIIRNVATFAQLNVEFTGTTGGSVLAGTIVQRSDGTQYTIDATVVVPASGTAIGLAICNTEGLTGNMDNGDTLTLLSPIAGVDSTLSVDSTDTEGEDEETLEEYRTRILERFRNPPAGGKVTDYIQYAKTVTGVTRAWVLPAWMGQGNVGVTFVEDNEVPIIPTPAKVTEVEEAILPLHPITATLFVFAPIEKQINPTIAISPNTPEVQAAVIEELNDLLLRDGKVRNSADPDRVGQSVLYSGIISLSKINEAISIAAGEEDHNLIFPTSDVQPLSGGLVTLGTVTFQNL